MLFLQPRSSESYSVILKGLGLCACLSHLIYILLITEV